jgi:hypothetical protein
MTTIERVCKTIANGVVCAAYDVKIGWYDAKIAFHSLLMKWYDTKIWWANNVYEDQDGFWMFGTCVKRK